MVRFSGFSDGKMIFILLTEVVAFNMKTIIINVRKPDFELILK